MTSTMESQDMVAEATLPARRQHKLVLQQALSEVEHENASLQAQYNALQPKLHKASAEIAACKQLVEETATQCERWHVARA